MLFFCHGKCRLYYCHGSKTKCLSSYGNSSNIGNEPVLVSISAAGNIHSSCSVFYYHWSHFCSTWLSTLAKPFRKQLLINLYCKIYNCFKISRIQKQNLFSPSIMVLLPFWQFSTDRCIFHGEHIVYW